MSRAALVPNSKSDPDNIYYTASIINNNTSTNGTDQDPIARFVETRDTPIVKDANDYEVSVLKVSINGGGKTLPILIPQIQVGNAVNNTIYSVVLNAVVYTTGGSGDTNSLVYVTSGETFLQWISELFDNGTQVPTTAQPTQVDTPYYYVYSYNHWVVIINNALQTAYTALLANINAIPGITGYVMGNRCPTVEFDENTRKFSFYMDTTNTAWGNTEGPPTYFYLGDPGNSTSTPVSPTATNVFPTVTQPLEFLYVGYNLNFEGLLTNFDTQFFGQNQVPWYFGYPVVNASTQQLFVPENTLIVRNKTGTNIQNVVDPATGQPFSPTPMLNYVITQDFESVGTLWSPVGAIVLTTQLLPLRNEFTSSPVTLGTGNLQAQGSAAFQTVLLDFSEDFMYADQFRGLLTFNPTAEFIPISMTQSHQEVKSMDFVISWRNRLTNQLVPLRIYNSSSISVRLLFRRKD